MFKIIKLKQPKEKRYAVASITLEASVFKKLIVLSKQYDISKAQICRHLIESYVDEIKFIK